MTKALDAAPASPQLLPGEEMVEEIAKILCRVYLIDDGFSEEQAIVHSTKTDMWKNFRKAARAVLQRLSSRETGVENAWQPSDTDYEHAQGIAWQAWKSHRLGDTDEHFKALDDALQHFTGSLSLRSMAVSPSLPGDGAGGEARRPLSCATRALIERAIGQMQQPLPPKDVKP